MKGILPLLLVAATFSAFGQQITTPGGSPLIVGNNGLRLSNINSSSTPQASNGVSLSVNPSGDVILVPSGGGASGWSQSGVNVFNSNTGNVGIGLNSPGYKLDVNGDLNLSAAGVFRVNGISTLRSPNASSIALGNKAGQALTSGPNNAFFGFESGLSTTTGQHNVFIGANTGRLNVDGSYNMFIGSNAGYSNSTGLNNTFIGGGAGMRNQSGKNNLYLGSNSGFNNNGNNNTFIGLSSGYGVQDVSNGSYNVFLGTESGFALTTGIDNIGIGSGAGYVLTTGNENVLLGPRAGSGLTTGIRNVFIGTDSKTTSNAVTNSVAIGYNASVSASNSIVLGANANVGIGVSAPSAKLEVKSGTTGSSGLKFTDLTSGAPGTIVTATRFLTVDANGNVVLGSTTGGREAASFAENWKLDAATKSLSNSNDGAVVIGQNLLKLPGSYRLFVQEGILTERVKVALRGTDDWSDKVFEPSYKLRSLNEVEQFIKENNHLPGVPSAKDMVKSGNDLHKTDAVLLEKIEELTLYMLELKKENEKLRKEVDQLKQSQQR